MTAEPAGFPDPSATVAPLLVVADLTRSLGFWADRVGAEVLVRWDTYAQVRLGGGQLHLAVTGDPPPDRAIRLVPPVGVEQATGEVVVHVADCRVVVAALEARGVRFLGPPAEPAWGGEVRTFALDPDGHLLEVTSHG